MIDLFWKELIKMLTSTKETKERAFPHFHALNITKATHWNGLVRNTNLKLMSTANNVYNIHTYIFVT